MPKYFKNVAITLVAFIALLANSTAWGQLGNTNDKWLEIICLFSQTFSIKGGYYDGNVEAASANPGSTWTTNPNLVTSKHAPNATPPVYRFISHYKEGTLAYPLTYDDPFGSGTWQTTEAVDFYWDYYHYRPYAHVPNHPSTYEKVTGPDPSMNCHGYSTEKNVWLNITYLLADDYQSIDKAKYLVSDAVVFGYGTFLNNGQSIDHSIRIDDVESIYVCVPGKGNELAEIKVVSISEKFRDSGVYSKVLNQSFDPEKSVKLNIPSAVGIEGCYIPN